MGITTGLLPAAAAVGMLFGFGLRAGVPGAAFTPLGALVGAGAAAGIILVVVLMLLCGITYSTLVAREQQHWLGWTIAIGAAVAIVFLIGERLGGGGIVLVLSSGNSIEIGIVTAIALPIGMRFALPQV